MVNADDDHENKLKYKRKVKNTCGLTPEENKVMLQ